MTLTCNLIQLQQKDKNTRHILIIMHMDVIFKIAFHYLDILKKYSINPTITKQLRYYNVSLND